MSMQTAGDIPLFITSENSSSERRVSPSWTIGQFKAKLEAITGIPPLSQKLTLRVPGQQGVPIEAADEENTQLVAFPLVADAEVHVTDIRPPGARPNYTDVSGVDKFILPIEEYEKKSDSVLAWKKSQKLGRFDPNAPTLEQAKVASFQSEIQSQGIEVGKRCRVRGEDTRRGEVKYVGEIPEIPGGLGAWVGIQLDEPMGKNDGSIGGKKYWDGKMKCGVFVRPDRVEVGDYPVLDDLEEDMEEI